MRDLDILESWKEISDYLKKAERTCRRWEKDFGLPIHRMDGSPKARVFAYKHELDKWIHEMLHEVDESGKRSIFSAFQFTFKKALFLLMGAVVLAIITLLIWQPWSEEQATLPHSYKPSLAIVYFENNTGDENLEYLRSGLSEWLITDLNQSKYLSVLSGARIYSILKRLNLLEARKYSTEDLVEISRMGEANYILKGSYLRLGENFVITVMLLRPPSEDYVSSIEVRCRGLEEIASKVDELTKQIKLNLNLTQQQIFGDVDRLIAIITTSSQEALRYFAEGRQWYYKGDWPSSILNLKKAIAVDPEFAMAYRKLSVVYNKMGNSLKRKECLKKAFELSDRVSDQERYLIQGDYYRSSWKTYDRAIETYKKLLELYPNTGSGNINFSVFYRDIEEWDEAIKYSEIACRNNTGWISFTIQARIYQCKGMFKNAIQVLQDYMNNNEDHPIVRWELANIYFAQAKFESAYAELDKSQSLNPIFPRVPRTRGDIYLIQHDFDKAEREYDRLFKFEDRLIHLDARNRMGALYVSLAKYEEAMNQTQKGIELAGKLGQLSWKSQAQMNMAYVCLRSGQLDKALKECEHAIRTALEAEDFNWQVRALYLKCLSLIKMKRLNQAEQVADELRGLIKSGMNRKIIRYYYLAMGQIEFEKGNSQRSIEYLEEVVTLLAYQSRPNRCYHTLFYGPIASAYYTLGNMKEAEKWCQRIVTLTTGRVFYGDIYAKSLYMLGKIHELRGDTAKAIEHYEKFLDQWKDADPGIAEVEDARERLAGLKSQ